MNTVQSPSPHLTNLRNDNHFPLWLSPTIKNFHAVYSEHKTGEKHSTQDQLYIYI
jgi:hypothetical protein